MKESIYAWKQGFPIKKIHSLAYYLEHSIFQQENTRNSLFKALHLNTCTGHEIALNTGANATRFFHFGDQILKISHQIGY